MRIIIALILYFTVRFFLTKNSSKKEMDVIFVMYALFILVIIFFKGDRYTSNSLRINMNPLEILNDFKTADNTIFLLLGNIVLYIPFGFYFPFRISFLKPKFLIPLFFVIPLLSESIQLIAGVGVFDINDIILNFLGFMMGFGGFRIACKRHKINT
jgi:glycopeptide antibiotics resistance protein